MKKTLPSTILLMRYNEKNQKNHCRQQWLFKINRNEKTDYSSNSAKSQTVGIRGFVLSE
jgi:hypothetical protein